MSKINEIHNYLKTGQSLTKLQCIEMFGYINLGDVVHVLRKRYGYDYIQTIMKRSLKTGKRFASFSINNKPELRFD